MSDNTRPVSFAEFTALTQQIASMSKIQSAVAQGALDLSHGSEATCRYYDAKFAHVSEVAYRLALQYALVLELLGTFAAAQGIDLDTVMQESPYLKALDERASIIAKLSTDVEAAQVEVANVAQQIAARRRDPLPHAKKSSAPARRSHFTSNRIRAEEPVQGDDRALDSILAKALSGASQD